MVVLSDLPPLVSPSIVCYALVSICCARGGIVACVSLVVVVAVALCFCSDPVLFSVQIRGFGVGVSRSECSDRRRPLIVTVGGDGMVVVRVFCNALVVNYFILVLFRVLVYYLNINM